MLQVAASVAGKRAGAASGVGAGREVLGDGGVVGGGVGEGLLHEVEAGGLGEGAGGLDLAGDPLVVGRVDHHAHVGRVLGRAAHHGRPADVDLLDHVGEGLAGRDRLAERVEVHHHEVDGRDVAGLHVGLVGGEAAPVEDAAVDARVEGLHAAAQDLGGGGVLAHRDDPEPGVGEGLLGPPGGEQVDALRGEAPGEGHEPGLVGDGEESAANGQGTPPERGRPF